MIPADIRNPARKSGYDHVAKEGPRSHWTGYQAQAYGGTRNKAGHSWIGPRRVTAVEAAQDYCDYVNGDPQRRMPKRLKSAGHASRRNPRNPDDLSDAEVALRKLTREVAAERAGRQGYVYCIAEDATSRPGETRAEPCFIVQNPKFPGSCFFIGQIGVKIGYSVDPRARVAELQTGNPRKLRLLGFIKGTIEDEARLHQRFIKDNVNVGEWFRPSDELLSIFHGQEG